MENEHFIMPRDEGNLMELLATRMHGCGNTAHVLGCQQYNTTYLTTSRPETGGKFKVLC